MNTLEKKLLKQQAEAYAFIYDLRKMALYTGNRFILERTVGIDETIAKRRVEYPRLFQRYFNAASKKAQATISGGAEEGTDGKRKMVSRRKEKPSKEKKKAKDRARISSSSRTLQGLE